MKRNLCGMGPFSSFGYASSFLMPILNGPLGDVAT
jgi:hypothetical protein